MCNSFEWVQSKDALMRLLYNLVTFVSFKGVQHSLHRVCDVIRKGGPREVELGCIFVTVRLVWQFI